ncbi:MAG: M20 metallopeptidase family protein [Opitutales bacterium]
MPRLLTPEIDRSLDRRVVAEEARIRDIRRQLHQRPEPSGAEFQTTDLIAGLLAESGIEHRVLPSGRGIIAEGGARAGPAGIVGLRADIDALRLQDEKTVVYQSREANLMHACGHDAHTAMLLGAVLALGGEPDLPFRWRALFQPAEETCKGAWEMIEGDALDNLSALVALHVDPLLPVGEVGLSPGTLTAICEEVEVTITGRGGHAARPHQTVDPVLGAVQFVQQVYQSVHRVIDARDPAVLTFGVIQGGINPNVIPEQVQLRGTLRTLSPDVSAAVQQRIRDVAEGVALAGGCRFGIHFPFLVHGVVNDPTVTARVGEAAEAVVGAESIRPVGDPSMGGEDFANYLEAVPGCLLRLGTGTPGQPEKTLHSPHFDIDEGALVIGARILAQAACRLAAGQAQTDRV